MMVETPKGVLRCLATGPADKSMATVVMIHGIQGTASVWGPTMQPLATGRRVLAPHLRGRAGSFSPDDPAAYSMAAFAGDLCAVLSVVRGPVILIGWSMGCLVALEYLRTYGTGKLIGLALISGSPCLTATGGDDAAWFNGDTPEAVMADAVARAERLQLSETATGIAVAGSWKDARNADYRDDLGAIGLPVLVLHGAEDPECPVSHARMMAEAIPGARLVIWKGCGHVPMTYAPGRFAAELDLFLHSCEASAREGSGHPSPDHRYL